jgi:ribosomal protein S18 acetylase RimI-like enzyme
MNWDVIIKWLPKLAQGATLTLELVAIAVVERERGRGVGSALLKAAEIRARAGGTPGITLHTAEANVAALELFTKRGFRVRRRLRRYYVGVFDACELVKKW